MENNSDKLLRDKLGSTEFPFDPQAWEQMEAMLDKRKKRRGFFWWWLSGVAAVSLLAVGTIGWGLYLMGEEDRQIAVETADRRQQTTVNTSEQLTLNNEENKTTAIGNKLQKAKSKEQNAIAGDKTPEIENQISEINTTGRAKGKLKKVKGNSSTVSIPSNQFHPFTASTSKNKKHKTTNRKQETNNPQLAPTNIQQEIEMLNAASATASAEENISLSRREASLLEYVSENATTSFDKKEEEDALPKKKKKIFNYSLGVLANITGTTLGKQDAGSVFYKTPSYMVGLTHDFLFINRIAITNSILYSQTSFEVYQPKTVSFAVAPTNYTSRITELAIPIGIKVYPVVKNNFRFYINTGIINHIKLKETFSYTMPTDTTPTSTPNFADQSIFPIETAFESNNKYADGLTTANGGDASTKDFSINNAKRYYASFYAGAGFEYVAKKHFILFAEPTFNMSLQKIGVQEKRKYNLGLSGGFRYKF